MTDSGLGSGGTSKDLLAQSRLNMELVMAVQSSDIDWVQNLLDRGAEPNFVVPLDDWENQGVVHVAAKVGNADVLDMLIKAGADINMTNERCQTALHLVVLMENVDAVRRLLAAKCEVNCRDDMGRTPLILAYTSSEIMQMLVDAGSILDAQDVFGSTALRASVVANSRESARILIQAGADVNLSSQKGMEYTPLMVAAMLAHADMVDLLLEFGADPAATARYRVTALHEAAIKATTSAILQRLLNAGCHPDVKNNQGETPLACAVKMCRADNVKILLKANCCVNFSFPIHNQTVTPTHLCLVECFELIKPYGTQTRPMTSTRRTMSRYFRIIKMLLLAGAVVTPLMFVKSNTQFLLDCCRELHIQGIEFEHYDVVDMLQDRVRNASTLQQLCRTWLRTYLGNRLASKVSSLPIPVCLQDYLGLPDIDDL